MRIAGKRDRRSGAAAWLILIAAVVLVALLLASERRVFSPVASTAWAEFAGLWPAAAVAGEERLPVAAIDIAFDEYQRLLAQRATALQTGVYVGTEADFVPADIQYAGETVPARLRLKQGPAAHLGENEKWNFEGRTRGGALLDGLQRFYLLDPADNNGLYQWAFNETLRREGLLASRAQPLRLVVNGDDRGEYLLLEGFGAELPVANGRPPGVIVEFDPAPLWQAIAAAGGDLGAAQSDPVTNLTATDFQFFEVDTFRDASIAEDAILSAQKDQAIGLLRGLQSGELSAAQVFDLEQYGRFLALADLWGAVEGASPVNLRYYYNPDSGLLEPVGFEANPLATGERLPVEATLEDPDLQAAYLRALNTYSDPGFLEALQADLQPELARWRQASGVSAGAPLPWEALAARQALLRQSLAPSQPIFAYLGPPALAQDGVIQVDVANVLNVPLEVLGFDIGGATFLEVDAATIVDGEENVTLEEAGPVILKAAAAATEPALRYVRFHLPLATIASQDQELDFLAEPEIRVATRISGLPETQLTAARPGYPDPLAAPAAAAGGAE